MDPQNMNYLTSENKVEVLSCTSEQRNCPASNVLTAQDKKLWLSEAGLPQELVIDMSKMLARPSCFTSFGWHCWHAYDSNPSQLELHFSVNKLSWIKWAQFQATHRRGAQVFQIDPVPAEYNFLKVIIKETFGAPKTYLNSLYLYEHVFRTTNESFTEEPSIISSVNYSYEEEEDFNSLKSKLHSQLDELRTGIRSPSCERLSTPKVPPKVPKPKSKFDDLKKEVGQWSTSIKQIQESLAVLTDRVQALERNIGEKDVGKQLHEFKKDIVEEINQKKNPDNEYFSYAFHRLMNDWELRVLTPQLEDFFAKIDQRLNQINKQKDTAALMAKLQQKIHEREEKMQQLGRYTPHSDLSESRMRNYKF